MNQSQYLAALQKLGLSQVGAAKVLGVSRRSAQRYAQGEQTIPEPIARLIQCYLEHGFPAAVITSLLPSRVPIE